MAGAEHAMMRTHIVAGPNIQIRLDANGGFHKRLVALSYPRTLRLPLSDLNAGMWGEPAIVFPYGGMLESIAVGSNGQTVLVNDVNTIPDSLRASDPCFQLGFMPANTVVHGVFFKSNEELNRPSAQAIKLGIFDISECDGEVFVNMDVARRQVRLRTLFCTAWYDLQKQATMHLCKKLQNHHTLACRQLGQSLMTEYTESTHYNEMPLSWSPEFLEMFGNYGWKEVGDYRYLLPPTMPEMNRVIRPIPSHIQLLPVMTVKACMEMKEDAHTKLPERPKFGGVLKIPELIDNSKPCCHYEL